MISTNSIPSSMKRKCRHTNKVVLRKYSPFVSCAFITFLLFWSWNLLVQPIEAIPKRGNEPWSLILCKFKDLSWYEPKSLEWFRHWFSGTNESESVENYFAQVSKGIYTISGSNIYGWITLKYTQKSVLAMVSKLDPDEGIEQTPMLGTSASFDYLEKIKELCFDAAVSEGFQPHRRRITVINSGHSAVFGKATGVLLSSELMFSSVLTHEMVHSFFIGHSYSDRKIKVFPYAASGEYDDRYDLMSTANAFMYRSKFGMNGPGLNGAHLDFLGWLPMDRMLFFGRDGNQTQTLLLSSLSVPHIKTKGWLLVIIPNDRDDTQSYYTVEFRTPVNFDRGIRQPSVLIHRVAKIKESYYSFLISQSQDYYELTENTEWVKFLDQSSDGHFPSIRVSVNKIYQDEAEVTISSTFKPNECKAGETEVAIDFNRNDGKHDFVCVNESKIPRQNLSLISSIYKLSESEIQIQIDRNNFYSNQKTFGANACKSDLVWRSLDPYDFVCITRSRQKMTRLANKRWNRNGETTETIVDCQRPFLKRKAFPGDNFCVPASEKFLIHKENKESSQKLQNLAFFNGIDTVEV